MQKRWFHSSFVALALFLLACDDTSSSTGNDPCEEVTCPSGQSCIDGACLRTGDSESDDVLADATDSVAVDTPADGVGNDSTV